MKSSSKKAALAGATASGVTATATSIAGGTILGVVAAPTIPIIAVAVAAGIATAAITKKICNDEKTK